MLTREFLDSKWVRVVFEDKTDRAFYVTDDVWLPRDERLLVAQSCPRPADKSIEELDPTNYFLLVEASGEVIRFSTGSCGWEQVVEVVAIMEDDEMDERQARLQILESGRTEAFEPYEYTLDPEVLGAFAATGAYPTEDEKAALSTMNKVLTLEQPWIDEPSLAAALRLAHASEQVQFDSELDPWVIFLAIAQGLVDRGLVKVRTKE